MILSSYSDTELIEKIKKGHKNVLIHLYEQNYSKTKDYIIKNGGSKSQVDAILKDALIKVWTNINNGDIIWRSDLNSYVEKAVVDLWNEAELKNYIELNRKGRKSHFNKIGFFVLIIIMLLMPVLWRHFQKMELSEQSFLGKNNSYLFNIDKNNNSLEDTKQSYANSKLKRKEPDRYNDTTLLSKDTMLTGEKILNKEDKNNENKKMVVSDDGEVLEENIVIKKDKLLFSKVIKIIDLTYLGEGRRNSNTNTNIDHLLAAESAEKLNPDAKLPENDRASQSFLVEFWESPINYRGYKLLKNKIILFGIDNPDVLQIYMLSGNIYIQHYQEFYLLEDAEDFQIFKKIKDHIILSKLDLK